MGAQRLETDEFAPGEVALRPRDARFDWNGAPLHWIPGDPYGSHVVTALNLLLPTAEREFCALLTHALEHVRDDHLREEIVGFIGQEAVHARSHDNLLAELLQQHGIDTKPFVLQLEWLAGLYNARMAKAAPHNRRKILASGTHALCAAEHFTGVLGVWALDNRWDELGVDPTMADLYRWHGAEEVEHRHVSYNAAKYFEMDYVAQLVAGVAVSIVLPVIVLRGTKFLVRQDPSLPNKGYLRLLWELRKSSRSGAIPTLGYLARAALRLLRPSYDPAHEGDTGRAVAYLAASPAARAARK